jgi:hypothetical protein
MHGVPVPHTRPAAVYEYSRRNSYSRIDAWHRAWHRAWLAQLLYDCTSRNSYSRIDDRTSPAVHGGPP